ncbi:MAG: hypothetical protein ACI8ZM_001297 [Crocinitomix sp.]|jgi:hypothetical protein
MKNIIYIATLLILSTSFTPKDKIHIWFPSEIGILQNCDNDEVKVLCELRTNSKKKIKVHSPNFGNNDFTLMTNNGKELNVTDTLYFNEKNPLELVLVYKIEALKKQNSFSFKTDHEDYLQNTIQLNYGKYSITTETIQAGNEQVLNLSETCNDSLTVHFPYGRTVSSVSLYKDSLRSAAPHKSISYGILDEINYLKFSKADIGSYFVSFGSCHWGNEFRLTIQ